MKIKDRPEYSTKSKPFTMTAGTKVSTAVKAMTEKNFGSVVVTDKEGHIEGIVTERDLMTRLLYNNMDPSKTKLSDIMTTDVKVAQEDDDLFSWLQIMSNERFRHLPVVDQDGVIVNMMSQGDFVSYTWPELFARLKETTKATLGAGYQVFLIIGALIIYGIITALITG